MAMKPHDLEEATLMYWSLSSTWHGRSNNPITVSTALQILGELLQSTQEQKALYPRLKALQIEIIIGVPSGKFYKAP